jgi:glutamate synthase (NADPH/NADH) large chain
MIGRVDRLKVRDTIEHWKAKGLDYSAILHQPRIAPDGSRRNTQSQDHGLEQAMDNELIVACADALEHRRPVALDRPIRNVHRAVGTMLGYEVTRRWGGAGLPDDTITVRFAGSAGQSFGASCRGHHARARRRRQRLRARDSGGRIVVAPLRQRDVRRRGERDRRERVLYGDERWDSSAASPASRGGQEFRAPPSSRVSAITAANT